MEDLIPPEFKDMPPVFKTLFKNLFIKPGFSIASNNECALFKAEHLNKDGYAYIGFRKGGKTTTASVQRVSLIVSEGKLDLGDNDASHLCHNKLCINPLHVSLEDRASNCQRRSCVSRGLCQRHPKGDGTVYPDCLLRLRR